MSNFDTIRFLSEVCRLHSADEGRENGHNKVTKYY